MTYFAPTAPMDTEPADTSWFGDTLVQSDATEWAQRSTLFPSQWVSMVAAFGDTGGLVSGDELVNLIRTQCPHGLPAHAFQPVSLVARWVVSRTVVVINSPWGQVMPLFQFDVPRASVLPGVQLALGELRDVLSDEELALWFVTPNEWLDGQRPACALKTKLRAVRHAARADRVVALGG